MKILSECKRFEVNGENQTITIKKEIGSLDFYKECMRIFSRAEFMDDEIPVIEYHNNIQCTGGWKYIGFDKIIPQDVTFDIHKEVKPKVEKLI